MLKFIPTALCASLSVSEVRLTLDNVQNTGMNFYLLAVSYSRLKEGDDDVTVPLLSASEGRRDEENLTGLPNPCRLSIGGHNPSYAY